MRYETHYSYGGHGGPHATVADANEYGARMLLGQPDETARVYVRDGVGGPVVRVIYRNGDKACVRMPLAWEV